MMKLNPLSTYVLYYMMRLNPLSNICVILHDEIEIPYMTHMLLMVKFVVKALIIVTDHRFAVGTAYVSYCGNIFYKLICNVK